MSASKHRLRKPVLTGLFIRNLLGDLAVAAALILTLVMISKGCTP